MIPRSSPKNFATFVAPAARHPGWWRFGCGLILIATCYLGLNFAVLALVARFAGQDAAGDAAIALASASTPATALILLATFLPLILGVILATAALHRIAPGTLLGPTGRVARDFLRGFGVMAAIVLPVFLLWSITWDTLPNLPLRLWLTVLPLTVVGVLMQTLAEELVFRGYLIQQFAARCSWRLIWAGLPAVIFAALHYDPGRLGEGAVAGPVAALAFAIVATDLTARTGGLGTAWGLHFANNFIAIALVSTGPVLSGLALRSTPYGPEALSQTPLLLVVELLPLLLAWVILRRLLSR